MEINTKTSTYNLNDKKNIKKISNTAIHKKMNSIIGVNGFNENGKILKSKNGLSAILKISSTDCALLSDDDMDHFESTLMSTVYGLTFPVKFIRSNRKQDFKKYINFIERCSVNIKNSQYLLEYKNNLYEEFRKMEKGTASNTKANYIVVYSSESEDELLALKELQDRVNYIVKSLSDNNFRLYPIGGIEMFEYLYFNFNKEFDINLQDFFDSGSFNIVCDKIGGFFHRTEWTENETLNIISEEERRMVEEKQTLLDSLSPKELKRFKKKEKKEKKKKDKELLKEIEEASAACTLITDLIKPDIFSEKEDYIKLGTASYARMLAVDTLPSTINVLTFNMLNNIENMETHVHLEKQNEAKLSKTLKAEYAKVISNMNINYEKTGTVDFANKKLAMNLNEMREAIETNTDKLFLSQIIVKLWSSSLVDLENKTKEIIESYSKLGMRLRVLFLEQSNAFTNTLPTGSFLYKDCRRNMTTGGASCLIPTGCTHLRHSEGRFIGRSLETNSPIILDPFICQKKHIQESSLYSNPNMYVVGKPGSGKSVFLKTEIARSMIFGDMHVVLDPEEEYKNISDKVGGHYVYLKNGEKTGINPLELSVSEDDDGIKKTVPLNEKIGELTALINSFITNYRNGKGLEGIEITNVTEAVRRVYEKRGISYNPESLYTINENGEKVKKLLPTLSDLRVEIEENKKDIPEVAEMMKLITGNGIMNLFDCQTDEGIRGMLDKRLVVFCLKELDNMTKTYAMTTILSWLWGVFSDWKLKHIQKNIHLDEAWRLAKHIQSLEFIENFVRRGRKYLISICLASQSITEFTSTDTGKSILNFCSTKFIFRQDSSLSKEICKFFGLPVEAQKRLPNFPKGQCIINTELGNIVAQVDLFGCEDFATT